MSTAREMLHTHGTSCRAPKICRDAESPYFIGASLHCTRKCAALWLVRFGKNIFCRAADFPLTADFDPLRDFAAPAHFLSSGIRKWLTGRTCRVQWQRLLVSRKTRKNGSATPRANYDFVELQLALVRVLPTTFWSSTFAASGAKACLCS